MEGSRDFTRLSPITNKTINESKEFLAGLASPQHRREVERDPATHKAYCVISSVIVSAYFYFSFYSDRKKCSIMLEESYDENCPNIRKLWRHEHRKINIDKQGESYTLREFQAES